MKAFSVPVSCVRALGRMDVRAFAETVAVSNPAELAEIRRKAAEEAEAAANRARLRSLRKSLTPVRNGKFWIKMLKRRGIAPEEIKIK